MGTSSHSNGSRRSVPAWHENFLRMLPGIRRCARHAFRNLRPEAREEAVADVTANALVAFIRLVDRGKIESPTRLSWPAMALPSIAAAVAWAPSSMFSTSPHPTAGR